MALAYKTTDHKFCSGWEGANHNPPIYGIVTVHIGPDKSYYCIDCWAAYTQDLIDEVEMLRVELETEDI